MPKVSQYTFDDSRMAKLISQLWNAFTLLEDKQEVRQFLSKFFTPVEIEMFAKRMELLKLADTDLEVKDLIKLSGLSKGTVYDWLEKHDAFEKDIHIIMDRIKAVDESRASSREKMVKNAGIPKHPRQPKVGKDVVDLSRKIVKGYKKRKKRSSVLGS